MVRSPPSPFVLPPLGPTLSESLVPVTMVSPWCRAWTRCFVILSWVSKQQQVHVKTVTGVLGPAGFVVLEQHGRLPATPYHPLLYLHPPTLPGTIIDVYPHSSYYVYLSCFFVRDVRISRFVYTICHTIICDTILSVTLLSVILLSVPLSTLTYIL